MLQIRSKGIILNTKPGQAVAITYTNPFFETDRVPIAVTTPIEFSITPQTRCFFQFTPGMLMKPQRTNIPAELLLDGIPICYGTLEYDEYSDTSLKYTFKGAEFEDAISGNLNTIPLRTFKSIWYKDLVQNARKGLYSEFSIPMIVQKSEVAKLEYKVDTDINTWSETSPQAKYANWLYTETPYFIPAVRIRAILNKILPGLIINSGEIESLLNILAILGFYKDETMRNNCGVQLTEYGGNPEAEYCAVNLNLADSLPGMSVAEFVVNLLKIVCGTLYCSGHSYVLWANKDILSSTHSVDWTDKVADSYSSTAEKNQGYSLYFRNESDNYTKAQSSQAPSSTIYECATMEAVLTKIKGYDNYVNVKHTPTGDIYSGRRAFAVLYYDPNNYADDRWSDIRTIAPSLDIVHQEGFTQKDITADPKAETTDCSIDFEVPRCMPVEVFAPRPLGSAAVGLKAIAPVIDIPDIGGERSDTVYIGMLRGNNFTDKGTYFADTVPDSNPGTEISSDNLTLAINGEMGLYEKYHRPYAEWLQKAKDPRHVNLNLTTLDIQNMELWSKHLIHNQRWLIRSLEVTADTSTNIKTTTAELVEA